jgi:hypothetical protein
MQPGVEDGSDRRTGSRVRRASLPQAETYLPLDSLSLGRLNRAMTKNAKESLLAAAKRAAQAHGYAGLNFRALAAPPCQ